MGRQPKQCARRPATGKARKRTGQHTLRAGRKKKLAVEPQPQIQLQLRPESLDAVWQQVLSQVGVILATELRKIQDIAILGPNALALRVPAGYNPPGGHYLDNNRLAKVQTVLGKIVGQACTVRLEVVGEAPAAQTPEATLDNSVTSTAGKQRQRLEIAQLPLIGKAIDALGGQIVQIDDDFGATPTEPSSAAQADGPNQGE